MKFNVDAIMQTMLDLYTYLLKSASKSKPGSDEEMKMLEFAAGLQAFAELYEEVAEHHEQTLH